MQKKVGDIKKTWGIRGEYTGFQDNKIFTNFLFTFTLNSMALVSTSKAKRPKIIAGGFSGVMVRSVT